MRFDAAGTIAAKLMDIFVVEFFICWYAEIPMAFLKKQKKKNNEIFEYILFMNHVLSW